MFTFEAVTSLYERLAWERNPFPYLSRVLDLPPLVAQAAFDAIRREHTLPEQNHSWHIHVPAGHLELLGPGRPSPPPRACYWPYREVPGTIRTTAWPLPIPVRLELVPWSRTRTALGLGVRRLPLLTGDGTYLQVAVRTLDVLTTELTAWGQHEVNELERWLRSHGAHDEAA